MSGRSKRTKDQFRAAAEKRLDALKARTPKTSPRDVPKLVHELQVHQIELEMQNDELRRAQSELEGSRNAYSDLYDLAPVGYFTLDRNGMVRSVNLRGAEFLGLERRHLIGRAFHMFVHPDSRQEFHSFQGLVFQAGVRQTCELQILRKNSPPCFAQLEGVAGTSGDELRLVTTDITERRNAAEQVRQLNAELETRVRVRTAQLTAANQELEAFCYSVAHDLRTPLRGIDGLTSVLMKTNFERLDERGKAFFQRVRSTSQEMARLIDDLLDLSRLTRQEMRHDAVDLSALAETLAGELRRREPEREAEFVIAPGLTAMGDVALLRVALTNLFENAWKFTGKRLATRIEFGVKTDSVPPVYFVRDNGAGFDMAHVDQLFRIFQRLHTTDEFPGTGIGLVTVGRVVRRHGGRVWAEGAVGHGATFFFTLIDVPRPAASFPADRRRADRRRVDRTPPAKVGSGH